jgi:hypothetical protein
MSWIDLWLVSGVASLAIVVGYFTNYSKGNQEEALQNLLKIRFKNIIICLCLINGILVIGFSVYYFVMLDFIASHI